MKEASFMDPTLLTTTTALLAPYLKKGAEAIAEKLGGSVTDAITALYQRLKERLMGAGAAEAFHDLEQTPDDGDIQAAFRVQLRKALEADPDLAREIAEAVAAIKKEGGEGLRQIANITGDDNTVIQISGSGNTIR
jgi:hypothetical protein